MKHEAVPNKLWIVICFISIIIPLWIVFAKVMSGNIPFWYDPARDMLMAWDNLSKLTLIGPPAGIPGIFYGPYWIWLLSFGLLFNKDPRIVTLLVLTVPYFILFPIILFSQYKKFGKIAVISVWLLYSFSSAINYGTMLWNPHLASFFILLLFCGTLMISFTRPMKRDFILATSIGVIAGVILNIHISFGLAVMTGTTTYFILMGFRSAFEGKKSSIHTGIKKQILTLCYIIGFFISFIPFILFEVRHGFNQIHVIVTTLTSNSAMVGLKGLTTDGILHEFFYTSYQLFYSPVLLYFVVILTILLSIRSVLKHSIMLDEIDKRVLLFTLLLTLSLLGIYLSSKNPVWPYHFIGVDMIFVILLLFLLRKFKPLQYLMMVTGIIVLFIHVLMYVKSVSVANAQTGELLGKMTAVKTIVSDAKGSDYSVYVYSPSIYVYEYSYLFRAIGHKNLPYDPSQINNNTQMTYLIYPSENNSKVADFVTYRGSSNKDTLTRILTQKDGIIISKKERIKH